MLKSSTTATIDPSAAMPPSKKYHKGGNQNTKLPTKKSGKRFHQQYHKRQNNGSPGRRPSEYDKLIYRLSIPASSSSSSSLPSGGLLERIGGSVEDEAASSDSSDRNNALDVYANFPLSIAPRYYTPEPGEVERFLESVIGAPPSLSSSPNVPVHTCSVDSKPASTTLDLPMDQAEVESPSQAVVSSRPSPNPMPDHYHQNLPLGDAMASASTSAIEECRDHLVSVLLASAHARDPRSHLDSEQCLRLLSDDRCRHFIQQAQEMQQQLTLVSPTTPVNQESSGSLKRDRVDEVCAWVRNTRSRFNSTNSVTSSVSRRDSDTTLVDFAGGRLPPKAPRAMLQASQAPLDSANRGAPYEPTLQLTSPTMQGHHPVVPTSASLLESAKKAFEAFPASPYTSQPVMDTSNVSMECSTGDPSGQHPSQAVSPDTQPTLSRSTDFTQPGVWFKCRGTQYAEIVDVDIEVGDEMFYLSCERQPSRLRMHLRLCSVPVSALVTENSGSDSARDLIDHHMFHWPKKGQLVLQVNPESEGSKNWLPYVLESDPVDVTSCMRPGKNTFRFIQLADLSEFAFLLVASPPSPEDEWRSWDWASSLLADRSRASSSDDAMNGLSEFVRLPVTART